MQSDIATKLKDILNNMTQEEFDKEWSEITALQLEGPTLTEAIEFFALMKNRMGKFEMVSNTPTTFEGNENYSQAA